MKKRVALLMVIMIAVFAFGCGNNEPKDEEPQQSVAQEPQSAPEPNTSAMVDSLVLQAKEDAKSADEEKLNEALSYIVDNYPEYFADNETMEAVIYNGSLLEYAYQDKDKTIAGLGMDAVQAVKYVYRGAESVEDDATKENLRQVKEAIDKL